MPTRFMSNVACKATVVHCMDFRIQKTVGELLKTIDIHEGDFDRVSIAGGAANAEQLKKHIGLSSALHSPQVFILTIHEDCGAGAKEGDLRNARNLIQSSYPECQIRTFIIKLDGTWEEK